MSVCNEQEGFSYGYSGFQYSRPKLNAQNAVNLRYQRCRSSVLIYVYSQDNLSNIKNITTETSNYEKTPINYYSKGKNIKQDYVNIIAWPL